MRAFGDDTTTTAYQSQIPPGCWNTAGFRDCATENWALAQQSCADTGSTDPNCAGTLYDAESMATCPCDPQIAPDPNAVAAAAQTAPPPPVGGLPSWAWVLIAGGVIYLILNKEGK